MSSNAQGETSFHPVPDGRFYTKANFFTLRNHSRDGMNVVSEQYQTDAEPGDQEVFEEMMHRRNQLDNASIQVPAVPGQHGHTIRSPPSEMYRGPVEYTDPSQAMSQSGYAYQRPHLQPISEHHRGQSVYETHTPGIYPHPGKSAKKKSKNS